MVYATFVQEPEQNYLHEDEAEAILRRLWLAGKVDLSEQLEDTLGTDPIIQ